MLLRIRVANPITNRKAYAFPMPEYTEYEGEVAPKPKWVKEDQFCLTTGNPDFPFRVIDKDRIICGWEMPTNKKNIIGPKTFNVKQYIVTQDGERWRCTCVGFGYRKKCSHIEECKAA